MQDYDIFISFFILFYFFLGGGGGLLKISLFSLDDKIPKISKKGHEYIFTILALHDLISFYFGFCYCKILGSLDFLKDKM